jgi:hypothetical protein
VVHAPAVEQRTLGAPPAAIVVAREQEESLACADECQDGDGCVYLDRGVMRHLECETTGATDRSILPRSATELGFLDRGSGADVRGPAPGGRRRRPRMSLRARLPIATTPEVAEIPRAGRSMQRRRPPPPPPPPPPSSARQRASAVGVLRTRRNACVKPAGWRRPRVLLSRAGAPKRDLGRPRRYHRENPRFRSRESRLRIPVRACARRRAGSARSKEISPGDRWRVKPSMCCRVCVVVAASMRQR